MEKTSGRGCYQSQMPEPELLLAGSSGVFRLNPQVEQKQVLTTEARRHGEFGEKLEVSWIGTDRVGLIEIGVEDRVPR
jgi:hypothetical protein